MFNVMNGGQHADWATDIQEFIVIPLKAKSADEIIRFGSEIFISLEKLLKDKGYSTNVGNEGGFAPDLNSNLEALDLISEAVEKAGYELGKDAGFGFDIAASEFYNLDSEKYELQTDGTTKSSDEMVEWIMGIIEDYPVISVEDPFDQDDWESWQKLTTKVSGQVQVVGDDLLVTNTTRIEKAIQQNSCNALLVKLNQIGTLTETLAAMNLAKNAGWKNVVSHRSGETEDITISHLAVGTGCGQIKTGAPSRGERTAKYNELIRISEKL
jgi:enolase